VKKVVLTTLNISDCLYEKLRFEAIREGKSVQQVIADRLFQNPFHEEVEEAYDNWLNQNINSMMNIP